MEAILKLEEINNSLFNDLFLSTDTGIFIYPCPYLTTSECDSDNFWKDLKCGRHQESPLYVLVLNTTSEIRSNIEIPKGFTEEFYLVSKAIKSVILDNEDRNIIREVKSNNNIYEGNVYVDQFESGDVSDIDKTKIDLKTFSTSEQDGVDRQVSIICIPREMYSQMPFNLTVKLSNKEKFIIKRASNII